jgi:hypothetical protein
MLMSSRTQFQPSSNAVLSLINKVAVLPERAFRLQSAGMMQGVQNETEDTLFVPARARY